MICTYSDWLPAKALGMWMVTSWQIVHKLYCLNKGVLLKETFSRLVKMFENNVCFQKLLSGVKVVTVWCVLNCCEEGVGLSFFPVGQTLNKLVSQKLRFWSDPLVVLERDFYLWGKFWSFCWRKNKLEAFHWECKLQ